MNERVLLLGTTGVQKNIVIDKLRQYVKKQSGGIDFVSRDFEHDYLSNILGQENMELPGYLEATTLQLRRHWKEGWSIFYKEYENKYIDKNFILCMHGVITRESTGTRSPIDLSLITKYKPTKIVVLIDNVYLNWHRTEGRSGGRQARGRPTLEQLLDARRTETFLGNFIACHVDPPPKFYVLAVRHPARVLYRLLFGGKEIRKAYLSFPITDPRNDRKQGDDTGIREVNNFIKMANDFEVKNPELVCFCPLTIDEYPLVKVLETEPKDSENVLFDTAEIWDAHLLWPEEILLSDDSNQPKQISLLREQVESAKGIIVSDVALRDYQLVRQSGRVAVFNPIYKGRESLGVRNEISYAKNLQIMVEYYQDEKHDPESVAKSIYSPPIGSLGGYPTRQWIAGNNSIEELFRQILHK